MVRDLLGFKSESWTEFIKALREDIPMKIEASLLSRLLSHLSLLLCGIGGLAGVAHAQAGATGISRQIPIQTLSRVEFCSRLSAGLQQYSLASGYNAKQSGLIASAAIDDLVAAFKSGRASDYINPSALAPSAPSPEYGSRNGHGSGDLEKPAGYIPMANFLAPALGVQPAQTVLALSAAELRFIPHVQQGMNIIVIAQNAAPLTPERAKAVAETAGRLKIKIHVLWVGATQSGDNENGASKGQTESQAMAFLAAVTGGIYADLSGSDHCGRSL